MTYPELVRAEIVRVRRFDEASAQGYETLRARSKDERLRDALAAQAQRSGLRADHLRTLCEQRGWIDDKPPVRCLEGVQHEAREILDAEWPGPVTDAIVACVAIRLLHLGIASRQTARLLAMGDLDVVGPFARALDEDREADGGFDWLLRTDLASVAKTDTRSEPDRRPTRR